MSRTGPEPKDYARPMRRVRRFTGIALLYDLGWGTWVLTRGDLYGLSCFAGVVGLILTMAWQTRLIRRMDRQRLIQLRPRPDYSAIAAMERDIYGEAFRHEGSIASMFLPKSPVLFTGTRSHAERECGACGYGYRPGDFGVCRKCDRQRDEHRSNLRWERPS